MLSDAPAPWSKPERGIRARLAIALDDIGAGVRCAVHVEIENRSLAPVAMDSRPALRARLTDAHGDEVAGCVLPGDGPLHDAQWAVIPSDAYLGLRVDAQSVAVPHRDSGTVLLAVGGRNWMLAAGAYTLDATMSASRREGAPCAPWIGELRLPAVTLNIDEPDAALR